MSPRVSIIILTCNGREFLKGCMTSVLEQDYDNFKVILVDNDSKDESLELVKDSFPEVEIIPLDKNYGFSKGHNIGIKYSLEKYNPDYFFLLNNDIKIIQEQTLKRLVEIAQNDKKAGILGCKLIDQDGKPQYVGGRFRSSSRFLFNWMEPSKENPDKVYEADIIIGAALFIRRSVIDKIGLLDEGFSPILYEEIDFCVRARRSGFVLKIVPSLEITHYIHQFLKRMPLDYIFRFNQKNYIRFMLLNAPIHMLILGLLCEIYNTLKYFATSIFKQKECFSPYLINIRNLKEIAWKRNHRAAKLWF